MNGSTNTKRRLGMKKALLVAAVCISLIACGSLGEENNIGVVWDDIVSPPESHSFLPLTPGIATTIEDGVLFSVNDGARTKDIVVETNEDGIAITGGFTSEVGTYDELIVEEQLYLEEQSDSVVISRYETFMDDVDGLSPSHVVITFDPAIVILEDKGEMAVGDVYTTNFVQVSYEGDILAHHYIPSQTDVPDDLIDATVTVEVVDSQEVIIEGNTVTAYLLVMLNMNLLPSQFIQSPFFTNMFSYSWMSFWLARDIGIVGLGQAFATSTGDENG
jgi:hypothetical protein